MPRHPRRSGTRRTGLRRSSAARASSSEPCQRSTSPSGTSSPRPPGCRSTTCSAVRCRRSVATYNTCAGPTYGRGWRPGYGDATEAGRFDDLAGFLDRPAELARELIDEGFAGMKIWPFDQIAKERGGSVISRADLASGLEPFRLIREAVGGSIEIMAEGHGFWSLGAATTIAKGLEPYEPAWIEDLILADSPEALAALRRSTSIPVLASEYLMTRFEYASMIRSGAVDHVMIDPTWCGGITEARRIIALADAARLPVTTHDCTGPFTLLAGVHLAFELDEPHLSGGRAWLPAPGLSRVRRRSGRAGQRQDPAARRGPASVRRSGRTSSIAPASSSDGADSRESAHDGRSAMKQYAGGSPW